MRFTFYLALLFFSCLSVNAGSWKLSILSKESEVIISEVMMTIHDRNDNESSLSISDISMKSRRKPTDQTSPQIHFQYKEGNLSYAEDITKLDQEIILLAECFGLRWINILRAEALSSDLNLSQALLFMKSMNERSKQLFNDLEVSQTSSECFNIDNYETHNVNVNENETFIYLRTSNDKSFNQESIELKFAGNRRFSGFVRTISHYTVDDNMIRLAEPILVTTVILERISPDE